MKQTMKRLAAVGVAVAIAATVAGCTAKPEPKWTPSQTEESPTPTAAATPGVLPEQEGPKDSDDALAKATELVDEFLPMNLKLSTEAAPAESMAAYVVEGSPAAQVVADTVRLNAENNAALVGDGQFRWMTFYQGSYAAPLETPTGEIIEFGSVYLQGCLYNEGLTFVMDGKPVEGYSTDPIRRQYTIDYDASDSRWKIQNIERLTDATFPC